MVEYSAFDWVIGSFMVGVTTISIFCSFLTIYLIHAIGRWNGFLCIIYSMTVCQIIYDTSFYLVGEPDLNQPMIATIIQLLTLFGGLSVTVWTNILSGLVFFIVMYRQPVDVWKYYPVFFFIAVIPPLFYAVLSLMFLTLALRDTIYNIIRLTSIVFNLVVYLIVRSQLDAISRHSYSYLGPLRELSGRLKYYPICQVITRIPATMYQFVYGFGPTDFEVQSTVAQTVAVAFYALFIPSAGIAYFCVFLCMQPQARSRLLNLWDHSKKWWLKTCCCFCCCCGGANSIQRTDTSGTEFPRVVNTDSSADSTFNIDASKASPPSMSSYVTRGTVQNSMHRSAALTSMTMNSERDSSSASPSTNDSISRRTSLSMLSAGVSHVLASDWSGKTRVTECTEMDEDELSRLLALNVSECALQRESQSNL